MEIGQQLNLELPAAAPAAPATARDDTFANSTPLHTQTQSTLAPTSEYVRYLLLALPARYIPRGIFGMLFETKSMPKNLFGNMLTGFAKLGQKAFGIDRLATLDARTLKAEHSYALAYNTIMGLGSLALTASYSRTVYNDIKNIFSEAVALETGKSADKVTTVDLRKSDNRIVQKTMENFWSRVKRRLIGDALFLPGAFARSDHAGDLAVGLKAGQAFTETWKRKTTMFEDLVTFINNKINPRNGLGQAIGVGEVFDLYQHYTEAFNPGQMFTNVLERGTGEGVRWAQSQPIFQRMVELMNLTYAYKHSTVIDPKTGHAVHQADFALPKFIYLLGHDLIDVNKPEQTLTTIEIANSPAGIPGVKKMRAMLGAGTSLAQIREHFHVAVNLTPVPIKAVQSTENGVIAKGSTRQLDSAENPASEFPATKIDAGTVKAVPQVAVEAARAH
ncbi:MAG: hypothetical protein ACOYNL_05235 [Rickettsiales bacterium]